MEAVKKTAVPDAGTKRLLERISGKLECLSYLVQEPYSDVLLDVVEELDAFLEEKE